MTDDQRAAIASALAGPVYVPGVGMVGVGEMAEVEGEKVVGIGERGEERMDTDEAERLARIFRDASAIPEAGHWDDLHPDDQAWYRIGVEAVAAALLPPGTTAVPDREVAALREFASAVLAHDDLLAWAKRRGLTILDHNASRDRVRAAIEGLRAAGFQPTDRAPIEEGGTHETTD